MYFFTQFIFLCFAGIGQRTIHASWEEERSKGGVFSSASVFGIIAEVCGTETFDLGV